MASDLIPTNISLGSTSVAPGASLSVNWLLANQGATAANSTSTTELRINQSSTSFAGTNLAGVSTAVLAGNSSTSQSTTLTAPTTPGTYFVWVIADNFTNVSNQSNTSNDAQHSVSFTVAAAAQSDLKPTNLSLGSTTVAPGAALSISWLLSNLGSGAADGTSTTELRINQSSTSFAGTNLAGVSTAALAGGTSASQSTTLTAPTTPGNYDVWVIADNFTNVHNQSDTSNDAQHIAFTVAAAAQSDLKPTNLSLGSTTVTPGASLSVSWLLSNLGSGAADGTSTTELRINQSSTSFAGTNLAGVSTAALAGNSSTSQSTTLTVPTTPGNYDVWVIADNFTNVHNQSDTSNDAQHIAFTVTAAPAQSDLTPTNLSLGSTTVAPGASLSVSWLLANQGSGAADGTSTTELRINQSSTSFAGTNLASVSTAVLAGNSSTSQSTTLTAPTTPGNYDVWVIADNFSNVHNQSDTSNDAQHIAFTVAVVEQSDLKPTNLSLGSTTVAPGASLPVSWLLSNLGFAAADGTSTTELRINQSSTSFAGTNLAGVSTAALAGGTSASQSTTLTAPTTPGNYDVWVIADNFTNVHNQSDTSNDAQHIAFTVAAAAQSDLIPTSISLGSTSVAPGASLPVSWFLTNQGSGAANSTSTTELRINPSSTSFAGTNLAGVSTAALAAGTSQSESAVLTAPTTPGTYYVWVIADDFSNVSNQSRTSNDAQHSVSFTVTGPTTTYSISPSPATVNENQGTLNFTITRSDSSGSQTVDVSTVQDQGNYNAPSGTTSTNYYYDGLANVAYTFSPGQSSIQVPIAIHDRGLTSGSEKFSFDVQSTWGSNLASTTFTILNNDTLTTTYSVSPNPAAVNENAGTLIFTITRSNSTGSQIVDVSTVQDQGYHNAASGTTSTNYYYDGLDNVAYAFSPGQSSIQVPIAIHDRGLTSGSEKFSFDVQSTSGSNLASTSFTIVNSDPAPTTLQPPSADVRPTINGPSSLPASVNDSLNFGSKISASDSDGSVEFYQFQRTSGSGVLTLGGVDSGASVKVPASQLLRVGFHAESSPGTDQIQVQAIDNQGAVSTPLNIAINVSALSGPTPAPDPGILADLSEDAYGANDKISHKPIGIDRYSVVPFDLNGHTVDDTLLGFRGVIYANSDESQVVVAFRGSDNWFNYIVDGGVWGANAANFLLPYFREAVSLVEDAEALYPNANIQLTGHSLGGALAELAGEAAHLNVTAFAAPGAQSFYPFLLGNLNNFDSQWLAQDRILRPAETDTNFRLYGDPWSYVDHQNWIGNTITLPPPDWNDNPFNHHDIHRLAGQVKEYSALQLDALPSGVDEPNLFVSGVVGGVSTTEGAVSWLGKELNAFKAYWFDPTGNSDFVYTQDQNSPNITSIDLPILPGVQSYELRYEIGNSWSAFEQVWPEQWHAFGPGVDGVEFVLLDSSGHAISVTDPVTFGLIFGATGAINATVNSTAQNFVFGGPGDDPLVGSSGPDTFVGGPGNDTLDGGLGIDTAVFSGPRAAYTLTRIGTTLQVSGPDGTDTLTHIEKLAFDDGTIPSGLNPLPHDVDADGHSDILLQNVKSGSAFIWEMNGTGLTGNGGVGWTPGAAWQVKDEGDYNGDGYADVLLQNVNTGDAYIWELNGTSLVGNGAAGWTPGAAWQAKQGGDFNGDGNTDILLQNVNTGAAFIWEMNGTSLIGNGSVGWTPGAAWQAKATGDFNGDGKSDIALQNVNTGDVYIWELDGTSLVGNGSVGWTPGAAWQVKAAGDYNGDGKSDILLQNANTGDVYIWELNGTSLIGNGPAGWTPGPAWQAKDGGDYNGDGKSDILLQNVNTGDAYMWLMNGTSLIGASPVGWTPGPDWHIS